MDGKETWYVRDASGNIMSVYSKDASINTGDVTQSEVHLYGSSRLGIYNFGIDVEHPAPNPSGIITFSRGKKFFELSNHLGNVLATISDKKIGHSTDGTTIDYYDADVISANDYYPGGMIMPERSFNSNSYDYGFNGQLKDDEIKGSGNSLSFRLRIYDPRIAKFLSVDPLTASYPWYTPYAFAGNTPILARDVEGGEPESMVTWQIEHDNKALLKNEITQDEWMARAKARAVGGLIGLGVVGAYYGGASALFWAFSHPIEATVLGGTVANAIDPNPAADYTPGLPGDEVLGNIIGQGLRSLAKTKVGSYTANQLGKMGEYALRMTYGGAKQTFKTSLGLRFVDNLANGIAYESKVGYTSATSFVKKQFAKDLALLDDAESGVKEVVWTFYKSPETGKVGASQPLLEMFKEAQEAGYNIRTQILDLSEEAVEQGAKTQ